MSIADRIAKARASKGWTQEQLAKKLGVGQESVHQWEAGKTVPNRKRIDLVASVLDMTPEELLFDAPLSKRAAWKGQKFFGEEGDVVVSAFGDQLIPLCSYEEAALWTASDDPYPVNNATGHVWANLEGLTERSFGLWVEGESMMEEFYPGDVIVVDPNVTPQPGDFVVAKLDKSKAVVFRKYRLSGEDERGEPKVELLPLNDNYPNIVMDGKNQGRIVATMLEHRKYRRRPGSSRSK
jgi:SOS-response transcriptional repressor LexA